jgi:sulfur carrier protein
MKIMFNGEARELKSDTTVAALLRELNINPNRIAVEVNLTIVPRSQQEGYLLRDGDHLEIVTLVGGG